MKPDAYTDEDLDLIETDRLVEALARRSEAMVVGMVTDLTTKVEQRYSRYKGSPLTCRGLAVWLDELLADSMYADDGDD